MPQKFAVFAFAALKVLTLVQKKNFVYFVIPPQRG